MNLKHDEIYFTGDPGFSPNPMEDIGGDISRGLRSSEIVFFLFTPNSLFKPWILTEVGGAFALGKGVFSVLLPSVRIEEVPPALIGRWAVLTGHEEANLHLDRVLSSTAQHLGVNELAGGRRTAAIQNFIKSARSHMDDLRLKINPLEWAARMNSRIASNRPIFFETPGGSGFEFKDITESAREEVFVAGQNLYFLTRGEAAPKIPGIIQSMKEKGKRLRLLICDPEYKPGVESWSIACGAEQYGSHLESVRDHWVF